MPIPPKPGDVIYVPTRRIYLRHGVEDALGGRTIVTEVKADAYGIWVSGQVNPYKFFDWGVISEQQAKLKAEFGDTLARPDPDYGREEKQWIS